MDADSLQFKDFQVIERPLVVVAHQPKLNTGSELTNYGIDEK
jgi:hypothetical protein